MDERDPHSEKHDDPIISTFRGISIDVSDDDENASDSIRVNRELDSNEIDKKNLHEEKHDDPIISTFRGISIDLSDEDEKALDSVRVNRACDSNVIISSLLF
jgi:hypothetical protein